MSNRNKNSKSNSRRYGIYSGKIVFVSRDLYGDIKKDIFNIEIEINKVNLDTEIFNDYNLLLENSVSQIQLIISSENGNPLENEKLVGINSNDRIKFSTPNRRQYAIKWVDTVDNPFLEVKVFGYDEVAVGLLEYIWIQIKIQKILIDVYTLEDLKWDKQILLIFVLHI